MKRYSIDGLPGYTMQGKKGKTGERGCMTFCNVMNVYNITKTYNYSIGIFIDDNDVITPIVFPSNKVIPIKGDYVIDVLQSISNLYVINDIIEFTKEDLIGDTSIEEGDSNLTEDEVFRKNILSAIYDSVKDFDKFVESLVSTDVYYIFTLSFMNSWTFRQGISSKDMDFSVAMQSFPIYRTPWKGEYTPKYLNKEITYVSSPYTPFAHVKSGNLVEDNQMSSIKLVDKDAETILFQKWPGVYRNIANMASYYIDIFDFDTDSFGYVFKKDPKSGFNINPYIFVDNGEKYENIDEFSCFGTIVNDDGTYSPKSENILNFLFPQQETEQESETTTNKSYNMIEVEREIIKNLNAIKVESEDDNNSEEGQEETVNSDYPNKEAVKEFIGNKVLLIQKDRSGINQSDDNHYLSFLKVNLFNSSPGNVQTKCIVNTKKVDMKSDGTLGQYKITHIANDIEFLHDPNIISTTKKINATIFLGKNHFNLNQINAASSELITTKYNCKNITHEEINNKDSYSFTDYEINVYDVPEMEINSFDRSDEFKMNTKDFKISNIIPPILNFKEWSFPNDDTGSNAVCNDNELSIDILGYSNRYSCKYLDFLLKDENDDTQNNYIEYSQINNTTHTFDKPGDNENIISTSEIKISDTADTYKIVSFPITLYHLYIGFHIIKFTNDYNLIYDDNKIQVGKTEYVGVPYIKNNENTNFSIISKKLYSFNSYNNDHQSNEGSGESGEETEEVIENNINADEYLITVENNNTVTSNNITSFLGKLDNDCCIVPCLYAKICKPEEENNEEDASHKYSEISSLELICEGDKIFRLKDLYSIFANDEDSVNIPFTFICNVNTFTNAKYYIPKEYKLCIASDITRTVDDINPVDENELEHYIFKKISSDTEESNNEECKNILYQNITQCVEVKNLETDDKGFINIPIISTIPTIHTNNGNEKDISTEKNVFAYIILEFTNNSVAEKAYLEYPFFASRTIIDKMFFSKTDKMLNCYLLPRKFYLNNKNITSITGAKYDPDINKNYITYEEGSNYFWNEYVIPQGASINDRTSFAEQSGAIPLGGLFKAINGNILYYDSNDPTLQESSQRFKKYDILTNTFKPYEDGEEYDKNDPENKITNVEELIDYHESLEVTPEKYSLTQFVVYSSLKPELLKNVKIEIELFNNDNTNIKNISSCVDNMWDTTKYTDDIRFIYDNDHEYSLPKKFMLDIMHDLYMGAVHNSTSVITEKILEYPTIPYISTRGYLKGTSAITNSYTNSILYHKHNELLSKYSTNERNKNSAESALTRLNNKLNENENENILKYAYISKTDNMSQITPDTQFIYSRIGWSKNYDNTLNFDKENIFPCTLVIKDYNHKVDNGMYTSTIMIPKELSDKCSMKIYAYIKNSSSAATKILIGETSMEQTY